MVCQDVAFGRGEGAWSFWDEALPLVYPFQREALKALTKRAWDAGETCGGPLGLCGEGGDRNP